MSQPLARKVLTEFIGTFALVFTIVCSVLLKQSLAPLAIASALMVTVYAGGHISGAHYNPAVSLAAFVRGCLPAGEVVPYWIAQFVGGAAAAGVGLYVTDKSVNHGPSFTGHQIGSAFVAELIFTFILCYVVLNVATSKDHPDNSFYGLAIGFTVLAGAVAVGGVSGGAFNPAVGLGISIAGLAAWANLWIYIVACSIGGGIAGLAFRILNPDDLELPSPSEVSLPEVATSLT